MNAPNSVAEVLASIDAARTFPAYNPEDPSEEVIGAWEGVRSWRDWLFQQDDITGRACSNEWSKEDEERLDDEQIRLEGFVRGNWATTPAGIVAQLSLAIIDVDQTAHLERCIIQSGLRAAYLQKDGMDGGSQQLIQAAYELQCMDWDQAVADYERSKPACKLAHDMLNGVDALMRRYPAMADVLAALRDHASATERAASNHRIVERLMKTLVAEPDEMPRKIQILIDENMLEDAGPWLLRDVAYLNASTKEA